MLIICINRVTNYFQFDIIPRLQENWIEYTKNSVWVSEPKSYRLFKLSQFCFTNVLCISSTAFQTCSFLDYVVTSPFSLAQNFSPHWCLSHLSESSKVTLMVVISLMLLISHTISLPDMCGVVRTVVIVVVGVRRWGITNMPQRR